MTDLVNNWLLLTRSIRHHTGITSGFPYVISIPRSHLRCKSGLVLSIQASTTHYCSPKDDQGPYTAVEVMISKGVRGKMVQGFGEYLDTDDNVMGWVPVEVVNKVIEDNGGIELEEKENGRR